MGGTHKEVQGISLGLLDGLNEAKSIFALQIGFASAYRLTLKLMMTSEKILPMLLFGSVLAVFNLVSGPLLATLCFLHRFEFLSDTFLGSFGSMALVGFLIHLVVTPLFAFSIVSKALSNDQPVVWCKRNGWIFVLAVALPFVIFSFMIFGRVRFF